MDMSMKINLRDETSTRIDEHAKQKIAAYVQKRVGGFECPDHHKVPTIIVYGTSLEDVGFDVEACCNKAIVLVKQKLSE